MRLRRLLDSRTVLTNDDLVEVFPQRRTKDSLLRYHQGKGRLLRARRGLYLVVPPGTTPETCPVDVYLLAARAAPDAILAYHTALEFHGRAHSPFQRLYYLSHEQQRPWAFRGFTFQRVAFPKALLQDGQERHGVQVAELAGEPVRVTSFERTLVDVLDRPDLAGGYEEAWRSLESVEYFDLDRVVEYALLLGNATTVAKVGFYLEQHRDELMVETSHLDALRKRLPKQPHYMARGSTGENTFLRDWNLVVPRTIVQRSWQEVS